MNPRCGLFAGIRICSHPGRRPSSPVRVYLGAWATCGGIEKVVGERENWSCLQSRRPSFLYGQRRVLEGWRGQVRPTLVVARWVAGRRAEKGRTWNDVGEGNRDAGLGKSTLTTIRGLGDLSLAERQNRRPNFLMALREKSKVSEKEERGGMKESTCMYGCSCHGCGKKQGGDGQSRIYFTLTRFKARPRLVCESDTFPS